MGSPVIQALVRHERTVVLWVAVVLVLLRSAVFVLFEVFFDSDQAIIGLMAKHLSEGRVFPLFTYGQDYNLAVEAWLAAPLFWFAGPSVALLKLPLVAINVAIVLLLITLFEKELRLRPALGLVAASFFVLAPPGTAKYFVEASGVNIEPFLVVLLLWVTRHRPLLFGLILAFGFLHREFVAYGLGALLLLEAAEGSLFSWATWRQKLATMVSFGAVWQVVQLLKPYSRVLGPGTSIDVYGSQAPFGALSSGQTLNLANLLTRFCWDPVMALANLSTLVTEYLGVMLGGVRTPLDHLIIESQRSQGAPGLWIVLGSTFVFALARIGWFVAKGQTPPWRGHLQFPTYLFLVGLQSGVVYLASRCDAIGVFTMRYSLLVVFAAAGVTACYLKMETSRRLRGGLLGVMLIWALVATVGHVRLLDEYVRHPPTNTRRALADHLVSENIKFGYADFWDAYSTVFFSNEQVILGSTSVVFIQEYEWLGAAHPDDIVEIRNVPCAGGTNGAPGLYVCPPGGQD
jgi:hypothetical protein